jgi:hypothetical protein
VLPFLAAAPQGAKPRIGKFGVRAGTVNLPTMRPQGALVFTARACDYDGMSDPMPLAMQLGPVWRAHRMVRLQLKPRSLANSEVAATVLEMSTT